MKNMLVAFLFCLTSTIVNAQIGPEFRQIPKQVLCGPVATILKGLSDPEISEQPLWIGKAEGALSDFVVFVNAKTGAFTIVQMGKEWGCILGLGPSSQQFKVESLQRM